MSDLAEYNQALSDFRKDNEGKCVRFFPERAPFWALASWLKKNEWTFDGWYLPCLSRIQSQDIEDDEGGRNYGIPNFVSYNSTDSQMEQAKAAQAKMGASGWAEVAWLGDVTIKPTRRVFPELPESRVEVSGYKHAVGSRAS